MATPHLYIHPPFFRVIPPFKQKFWNPPSASIFGRSYPPFNNTFFLTLLIFYFSFFARMMLIQKPFKHLSRSFLQKKKSLKTANFFPKSLISLISLMFDWDQNAPQDLMFQEHCFCSPIWIICYPQKIKC